MPAPKRKSRFCEACPLKLSDYPSAPCPLAMEQIHAIQVRLAERRRDDSDSAIGCQWAINSSEHNYCFWSYARTLDEPVSDKEISQLLGMTQSAIDKAFNSAINKLKSIQDTEVIKDFVEHVRAISSMQHLDNTTYLPDSFTESIKSQPESEEDDPDADVASKLIVEKERKKRKLRKSGLPVHRSGDKLDLFGIYSKKKLDEIKGSKK